MRPDVFLFFTALFLLFFLLTLKAIERKKGRTTLLPGLRRSADKFIMRLAHSLRDTTSFIWKRAWRNLSRNLRKYSKNFRNRMINLLGGSQ